MGEKLVDSYYIERLHTLIQELEEEVKAKKDGWCICIGENIRLRKALELAEEHIKARLPKGDAGTALVLLNITKALRDT